MALAVEVQELAIVVATKNHSPSILSPEFLQCSGILPRELELSQAPISTPQFAQLLFRNGISLIAQVDRVIFVEQIATKSLAEVTIAQIASRYLTALPQADYQGVGINVQGLIPLSGEAAVAHSYLTHTLLKSGAWQEFGQTPVQASVQLKYTLEHARLTLALVEAALQLPDGETTPIVVCSGHFDHRVTEAARMPQILQSMARWQSDVETYQELLNTRFFQSPPPVEPTLLPVFTAVGV